MDNYFLISIHQSWMSKLPIRNPLKLGVCMYKQVKLAYYCSNRVSHATSYILLIVQQEERLTSAWVTCWHFSLGHSPITGLRSRSHSQLQCNQCVSNSINLCNGPHTPNQVPHLADFKNFIYAMKNHGWFGLY